MADHRDDFIIAIRYALLKKGTKQKFSLFFLIILSISIITLDKFSPPIINPVRAVLNDFVYYVSVVSSQPSKYRRYFFDKTKLHYNTLNENKFLKKALDLSVAKGLEQDFSISAKVILDQASPFLKSILINKGTRDSIKKGMPVFSNDYLMGTVIEINYFTSRVLLLTDLNSKLPVIIEGTNINAILEGTGKSNNLRLMYLPENNILEPNKIIFTSGKGGFLSPGIPVAETYLNKKNKVLIRLLGDPNQALIVNVSNGKVKK